MKSRILTRATALAVAPVLAAAGFVASSDGAQAAIERYPAVISKTEPPMPIELCHSALNLKIWVDCATGKKLNRTQLRYFQRQWLYHDSRIINAGVPVYWGSFGKSTQHVPVPKGFQGRAVTVEATMSSVPNPGCNWFMFQIARSKNSGDIEPLDKGKFYAAGQGTTVIEGSALTLSIPNFIGPSRYWFVDLTITRGDGKKFRVTLGGGRTVRNGTDAFVFGS